MARALAVAARSQRFRLARRTAHGDGWPRIVGPLQLGRQREEISTTWAIEEDAQRLGGASTLGVPGGAATSAGAPAAPARQREPKSRCNDASSDGARTARRRTPT